MIEQEDSKVCMLSFVAQLLSVPISVLGWVQTKVKWCASLQDFDTSYEVFIQPVANRCSIRKTQHYFMKDVVCS